MSNLMTRIAGWVFVLAMIVAPLLLSDFWLQTGLFIMSWAVAAVGLTLLVGLAGQLSLGNAFFAAVGAYTYAWLAGPADGSWYGVGLPPIVATVIAVAAAALCGGVFSPISGRLRGVYLGLATLGLVFLGEYLILNMHSATGGYDGRSVEPFSLFGFSFSNSNPDYLGILGVSFSSLHRNWYLFLVIAVIAVWIALNIKRGRTGREFINVRDSETAAAALGINVVKTKAVAFVVSSAFAGAGGVLLALAYGRVAPELFALMASIEVLVIIVLGRLGSIVGAIAGSVFVVGLPLLLVQYSSSIPLVADPGTGGLDGATVGRLLYGVALIAALIFFRDSLFGTLRQFVLAQLTRRPGDCEATTRSTGMCRAVPTTGRGDGR